MAITKFGGMAPHRIKELVEEYLLRTGAISSERELDRVEDFSDLATGQAELRARLKAMRLPVAIREAMDDAMVLIGDPVRRAVAEAAAPETFATLYRLANAIADVIHPRTVPIDPNIVFGYVHHYEKQVNAFAAAAKSDADRKLTKGLSIPEHLLNDIATGKATWESSAKRWQVDHAASVAPRPAPEPTDDRGLAAAARDIRAGMGDEYPGLRRTEPGTTLAGGAERTTPAAAADRPEVSRQGIQTERGLQAQEAPGRSGVRSEFPQRGGGEQSAQADDDPAGGETA